MTGRRLRSYRSGDWNEELGILLLKAFAAVAPVPRPEDFGLDAVATLLRPDVEGKFFYAEDSFYVQFKSESTKPISYKDHELKWLKNLQLPFFIGVVRKKDSRLSLFPGTELNAFLVMRDFKKLIVRLHEQGDRVRDHGKDHCEVFLGKPFLSFSIAQASDKAYRRLAYDMLEDYLGIEQENVASRHIRCCRRIEWRTNKKVFPPDGQAIMLRSDSQKDDLHKACQTLAPGMSIVELFAEATEDRELARVSKELVGHLRKILTMQEPIGEKGGAWMTWKDPFPFLD
jgi:hypothetical protein